MYRKFKGDLFIVPRLICTCDSFRLISRNPRVTYDLSSTVDKGVSSDSVRHAAREKRENFAYHAAELHRVIGNG